MTRNRKFLLGLLAAILWPVLPCPRAVAADSDSLFIYLPGGRLDVYPPDVVQRQDVNELQVAVVTIDGRSHIYARTQIDSVSHRGPALPVLTSFKFNNKFNGQVFTDVQCGIGADGLITGSVPAIGKWLTPSFQRSDSTSLVYVGRELQRSKVTRRSFAAPVDYVVTLPGWQVMTLGTTSADPAPEPEPEPDPEPLPEGLDASAVRIDLAADWLSTNAPTMREDEDLPSLLDGNDYTFFHSTWSASGYTPLPLDSCPWIEVTLPEPLSRLQLRYETRQAGDRWPVALRIDVSADGTSWTPVSEFTTDDGLPQAELAWWTSPVVDLHGSYAHLRLVCTKAAYKNYLCLAELELYSVPDSGSDPGSGPDDDDPTPQLPDGQTLDWQPFGTRYTVSIDWPTDRAVDVPSIYISTDDGILPYDRETYLSGTFRIDGAGVFPDMEETEMRIKGRGNSSWAGTWGKSPYRLKFDTKVKPFGLTKGKSWVLLANSIGGSMMTNAIGMKVAQLAGAAGANHIVPVNLYVNGEFRGSYNFTEKTGFSNNSIDLDDETYATLLELDTYTDETIYRTRYFNVPVKIHEPDFEDPETISPLDPDIIVDDFSELLAAANDGDDVSRYLQVDTFAAFYLTNEYIMNQELMHPKSTFLYKEHVGDPASLWKFGPVWDLDWAFGHEMNSGYFTTAATSDFITAKSMECNRLWRALRGAGTTLDRAYYLAWTRFLRSGAVGELTDFCQEYYDYAEPSFRQNADRWGDGRSYGSQIAQQQSWLQKRADYIYKRLNAYDLTEDLPEDEPWQPFTDADEPDPVDLSPYMTLRAAVLAIVDDPDAYSAPAAEADAVLSAVGEQNAAIALATTAADVRQASETLRQAFLQFLGSEELQLLKPFDLTDILITNSAPVENADGWTCSETPATFDPVNRVAEFLGQPGATIAQTPDLPAGTYQWSAVALTRSGYNAYVYAAAESQKLKTAARSVVGDLAAARQWFDKGNGLATLEFAVPQPGPVELGLRADAVSGDHWTVWSHFRLVMTSCDVAPDALPALPAATDLAAAPVYDLAGRRVADRYDRFLRQTRRQPGIYVVAGHRLLLR